MEYNAGDYDLFDDEPTGFARWIMPALIISLLLHVIFYMWARGYPFQPFSEAYYDKIVPRTFQLERVEIDPKLLDPAPDEEIKEAAAPKAVELPEEKVSFENMMADIKATPAAPEIENPILDDKPRVDPTSFEETVKVAEKNGAATVAEDMDALREELLVDKPEVSGRPLIELTRPGEAGDGAPDSLGPTAGGDTPGFSNLDTLLAQTGPLTDETAPIMMPADLLFDYDSYQLRDAAVSSLQKLGQLIRRNPDVDFIIEGHTDSFGGEVYNRQLSRMRAESVKHWLVQAMGIDASRIETRGFGSSRLIAPATGSIEEQQINRRVEIVIRARGSR